MEIKKSPKADLENKRGLFLEIGLVVALVLVIGAFAVTPKEHRIEKVDLPRDRGFRLHPEGAQD